MKKYRKILAAAVVSIGIIAGSVPSFAFDVDKDAGKYYQVKSTNIYTDGTTSKSEVEAVVDYWNKVPKSIRSMMRDYDIKIYLVGDGSNIQNTYTTQKSEIVINENSPDLIPYTDSNGPAFIEKDPYNLNNLKLVKKDGRNYILYHGTYITCEDTNKVDWDTLKAMYIEDAPYFGANYFNNCETESAAVTYNDVNLSSVCATSWGSSVEYDADNGYVFVKVTKPGWTEYYSNNTAYFPENIIHEIGHQLDWMSVYANNGNYKGTLCGISDSPEWKSLYQANVSKLATIDALASSNMPFSASEGFADSFRLAYQKPDTLKTVCPEVYQYIIATVSKYTKETINKNEFDYRLYADTYADLKAAFGYDRDALWNHFITCGRTEGRTVSCK